MDEEIASRYLNKTERIIIITPNILMSAIISLEKGLFQRKFLWTVLQKICLLIIQVGVFTT